MAMQFVAACLAVVLGGCTIEAKVPEPKVTIACLELVAGGEPVARKCEADDAGKDSSR